MPRQKVSVTLDRDLLRQVDRAAASTTRSAIVERALHSWLRSQRQELLETEIERYYRDLPDESRDEDREWAELAGKSLQETWK